MTTADDLMREVNRLVFSVLRGEDLEQDPEVLRRQIKLLRVRIKAIRSGKPWQG